jgi:hypothetical protein
VADGCAGACGEQDPVRRADIRVRILRPPDVRPGRRVHIGEAPGQRRTFSNTFAGIAPSSAPVFIAAQVGGGIAGVLIIKILYPALTPARQPASSYRTRRLAARAPGGTAG